MFLLFLPLAPRIPAAKAPPPLAGVTLPVKVIERLLPHLSDTHLPASLVVVQVHGHQPALARSVLQRHIQELPAEGHSVVDVVRAAAPVPSLAGGAAVPQGDIAGALGHVPRAAGARHRVHQPRRRHRRHERRLLRACTARRANITPAPPLVTFLAPTPQNRGPPTPN